MLPPMRTERRSAARRPPLDRVPACLRPALAALWFQPGRWPLLASLAFAAAALVTRRAGWALAGCAVLLPLALWQRFSRLDAGENFTALRSLPFPGRGSSFFLCQRRRRGVSSLSCRALRRSLLADRDGMWEDLPAGRYLTVTHDAALRVLHEDPRVRFDAPPAPLYSCTLRPVLSAWTRGRCRRCKHRCAAWRCEARTFYLVRFSLL